MIRIKLFPGGQRFLATPNAPMGRSRSWSRGFGARNLLLVLASGLVLLGGCVSAPFVASPVDRAPFMERALEQTDGTVRVMAAVPDADETRDLIGLDLYAKGIQPVWLQVSNLGDARVRTAPHSIDSAYFSPMEVAWKFRRKFSKKGRADMERWFYENQLPRRIPAGETRSGFVYTHFEKGSKGFNFDVYTSEGSFNFTFFIRIPGFTADYMNVDFDNLYARDEFRVVDINGLRTALESFPCCSKSESGDGIGDPVNVVIVGSRIAVRRSLLRGRWQETALDDPQTAVARTHRLFGRRPDGTFHKTRPDGSERKELRLWASPILVGDTPVWVGQISYELSATTGKRASTTYEIDPDIDDARMYLLQTFWYSQSLHGMGFVKGVPKSSIDAPAHNFAGAEYFTDGLRVVLILSEDPVAMDEVDLLPWDSPMFE
ncbi:MAG: LssY C-terminal domain-containing protein [Burkholderiales bacterium]|jgi:hypothetical protein